MASRRETELRKQRLKQFLREECLKGHGQTNRLLPPVRQLAEDFGLSMMLVWHLIKELEGEGLLYTVPRVGTFIGRSARVCTDYYLMLVRTLGGSTNWHLWQTRQGFEERVAALGGASLVMPLEMFVRCVRERTLPPLAGIFYFDEENHLWPQEAKVLDVPKVQFRSSNTFLRVCDQVSFNDREGGRLATQHLLSQGHRRIAFLGLHKNEHDLVFDWSYQREEGWREVLLEVGLSPQGLAFHPPADASYTVTYSMKALAKEAARPLLGLEDVTGVVCANDDAALGFLCALQEAGIPHERWPALVGFDDEPEVAACHNISSFRLPWSEIGRTAANMMWERKHHLLHGKFQHRYVPMLLILRLTSPACWSQSPTRVDMVIPPKT